MWSAITRYAVSFRSSSLPVYGRAGHLLNRREDRREHVGVVVARFLPCSTAVMRSKPMPVSTCLAGSGVSLPVRVAVELDEHQVPDLDHARVAGVDELAAGLVGRAVDVDFGARAARAGLAHLPEVVLLVAEVDVSGSMSADAPPESPRPRRRAGCRSFRRLRRR